MAAMSSCNRLVDAALGEYIDFFVSRAEQNDAPLAQAGEPQHEVSTKGEQRHRSSPKSQLEAEQEWNRWRLHDLDGQPTTGSACVRACVPGSRVITSHTRLTVASSDVTWLCQWGEHA